MKKMNYLRVAGTLIVLFFIASSCSTTKKMALPCPEPASRFHSKTSLNHPRNNKNRLTTATKESKGNYSFNKPATPSNKFQNKPVNTLERLNQQQNNTASAQPDGLTAANKIDYETNLYAAADNSAILAEEAYSAASMPAGEMLNFTTKPIVTVPLDDTITPQKTHGMAIAGLGAGITGFLLMHSLLGIPQTLELFLAVLLIGLGGIVLSGIALRKIKENPEKYKGKGLAKAGVVIGIVFSILWLCASFVALLASQSR